MAGRVENDDFPSFPAIISFQEDEHVASLENESATQQILSPMTPKKPKKKKERSSPRSEKVERIMNSNIETALVPVKAYRHLLQPTLMPATLLSAVSWRY